MADSLRPVQRPRLYEQLVARLLEHIASTGLAAGDRLPPERELAARLGVSRNSLKQAFVVLEVQGLVDIRQGDGTYLRRSELTPEPVDVLLDRQARLPYILEAREAIEAKIAELAAERRTEEDLQAMEDALAAMGEEVRQGLTGASGDQLFHAAVVAAGHSPILENFYTALAPQIAETREESLKQTGRPQISLHQHELILAAIRAGNPIAAVDAVRGHVQTVRAVRLLEWQPPEPD